MLTPEDPAALAHLAWHELVEMAEKELPILVLGRLQPHQRGHQDQVVPEERTWSMPDPGAPRPPARLSHAADQGLHRDQLFGLAGADLGGAVFAGLQLRLPLLPQLQHPGGRPGQLDDPAAWTASWTRLRPFVGWIDGVVVSGGEPTLHPGLDELLGEIEAGGLQGEAGHQRLQARGRCARVVERAWWTWWPWT